MRTPPRDHSASLLSRARSARWTLRPIGGEKLYDCVLGKPAVAMALNLDRAPVEHCDLYRKFFGVPFPEEAFRPHPIPPALRSELELVAEVSYDAALPYQLTELVA